MSTSTLVEIVGIIRSVVNIHVDRKTHAYNVLDV